MGRSSSLRGVRRRQPRETSQSPRTRRRRRVVDGRALTSPAEHRRHACRFCVLGPSSHGHWRAHDTDHIDRPYQAARSMCASPTGSRPQRQLGALGPSRLASAGPCLHGRRGCRPRCGPAREAARRTCAGLVLPWAKVSLGGPVTRARIPRSMPSKTMRWMG